MKAFVDRNYFLYTHNIPLAAKIAGLIIVAGGAGIEHTERALRRFIAFYVGNDRVATVTGLAGRPGDIKRVASTIEEAQNLGRVMASKLG